MKKDMMKEYFSIPNLIGYFRILLVPVYLYIYITADSPGDYKLAALIMILSFLTDFFDGKIARRFNMVTDFGKILDPIADKITQGALALSFTFRYPAMMILLLMFVFKETIMGLLGVFMMKKGYRMNGAQMHGKICTAVLDVVMFLTLLLPEMSYVVVNILVSVSIGVMGVSFILYMRMYWKAWEIQIKGKQVQETPIKGRRRIVMVAIVVVAAILYLVLGAILPFVKQPKVSNATVNSLDCKRFYGEQLSGERVKVISQNGEALTERIRLISQAEEEIILSSFEFDADTSGTMVLAALAEAADRGVKVSVLVDGFPYIKAMWGNPYFLALAEMDNVEIRVYNPVRLWKPWGLMGRLHDKYLVVDDKAFILGGRNTYDFFLGDQLGYKNYDWDFFVYSEQSDDKSALKQVRAYFDEIWNLKECKTLGKGILWKHNPSVLRAEKYLEEHINQLRDQHPDWFEKVDYHEMTLPAERITLVTNPTHIFAKEPVVFYTITELMKQAKDQVYFHTPYIIADEWMLKQLQEVCEQVKDVWMMTNSVANNGNPFGAMDYQRFKEDILNTGVKIMEYDGGISYHGKCFTMDDQISAIGSFNWDMRSAYLDTEMMLIVDSPEVNRQLREEMEKYEKESLVVKDTKTYEMAEGKEPKELSGKEAFMLRFLKVAAGWARFLM